MARQLLGIPFLVPLRGCFGNYKIPKLMGRRPAAMVGPRPSTLLQRELVELLVPF